MMVIVMEPEAPLEQLSDVLRRLEDSGVTPHLSREPGRVSIGVTALLPAPQQEELRAMRGVAEISGVRQPFKLASREFRPEDTIVNVGGVELGAERFVLIAGPCAVESEEQVCAAARAAAASGARILRGGAFKPRSSPYAFQGMGLPGLRLLKAAGESCGLPIVTEVLHPEMVGPISEYSDMLQIGARNMQNFALLEAAGRSERPVLLKRGMMASIEELLMSAEYVLAAGNSQVVLCERGIRTFESYTRNTLDIAAVAALKQLTHLPVIVDPSHATGRRELIRPMSLAAVAAGADGLIIEAHPCPDDALCDGKQSLTPEMLAEVGSALGPICSAMGRSF
ncbi:MAG: 3-deoxy-7-phosphoheptulonate synthase [bacterium]